MAIFPSSLRDQKLKPLPVITGALWSRDSWWPRTRRQRAGVRDGASNACAAAGDQSCFSGEIDVQFILDRTRITTYFSLIMRIFTILSPSS
jgi:hypothetical protein